MVRLRPLVLAFLVCVLCLLGWNSARADDDQVMYRVQFTVVYNEVSATEMARTLKGVAVEHEDACKVDIEVSKALESDDSIVSYVTESNWN